MSALDRLLVAAVIACFITLGCSSCGDNTPAQQVTSNGIVVLRESDSPTNDGLRTVSQVCYKGVTYIQVYWGNATWGSVMLDKDSKIVPC